VHFWVGAQQRGAFVVRFWFGAQQDFFPYIYICVCVCVILSPKNNWSATNFLLTLKFFILITYNMWCFMVKFGRFLYSFDIFNISSIFFEIIQIYTTSDSNDRTIWVKKWYSCYLAQFKTFSMKSKEISNILTKKHDHGVSRWFKNSQKCKWSLKIMRFYLCLMISYVKTVVKIWMSFEHFIMYDAYISKYLWWNFRELRSIWLSLDWKWQSNVNHYSNCFLSAIDKHKLAYVKFWCF
jgi:hypothetical protein